MPSTNSCQKKILSGQQATPPLLGGKSLVKEGLFVVQLPQINYTLLAGKRPVQ